MKRQAYLYVSGCIFGVTAILNFGPDEIQLPAQIGTLSFPVGLSWLCGVVELIFFQLAGRKE